MGGADAGGEQARVARMTTGGLRGVRRRAGVEGVAFRPAEHAREHPGREHDLGGDRATFLDADDPPVESVGDPHRTVAVEADAVRRDGRGAHRGLDRLGGQVRSERGPGALPIEPAVGPDVEGGQLVAHALRDDQRAGGGDHHAVGEAEVGGLDGEGAVRRDADQVGRRDRGVAFEFEAEAAHVGGAVLGDHHVVELAGRDRGEIGVDDDLAVVLAAHDPPGLHRGDEQAPVGQPAEPGRLVAGEGGLDGDRTVGTDRDHLVPVEIRDPHSSVVPARALEEGTVGDDGVDGALQRGVLVSGSHGRWPSVVDAGRRQMRGDAPGTLFQASPIMRIDKGLCRAVLQIIMRMVMVMCITRWAPTLRIRSGVVDVLSKPMPHTKEMPWPSIPPPPRSSPRWPRQAALRCTR
ncbi:hypothetical protein RHRU231_360077 [Rhodococcus ruber]|uniref:Uncharacterized protein n=1 Tax=Rhodococcus ruber TaxID=1830 RepID=A0A098BIB7_9NOCA|nr:hypothetical protein RHRU231_360077 [Rhodococcus ruber]